MELCLGYSEEQKQDGQDERNAPGLLRRAVGEARASTTRPERNGAASRTRLILRKRLR